MTKKDTVKHIKKCIDEISKNKQYGNDMLSCLNFMCNLMANDVGTEFLRGGSVERNFVIEELQVKVSYIGDRHKSKK